MELRRKGISSYLSILLNNSHPPERGWWVSGYDSHGCLFYFTFYTDTHTHALFLKLPTSFFLPSPCKSKWCSEKRTHQAMHEDIHLMISKCTPKYITDFSLQMQAGHPQISNVNIQKWGLISESELASLRYEGNPPLRLVTVYSGPGRMSVLKPVWIQLGWSWGERLHTLKRITLMLYVIFLHYSIRNFGPGKQSKALTVFSSYINSAKWSTVHF